MTESNRQRLTIACAGATALAFPLSILFPPFLAVGLAALYYFWFAHETVWLIISVVVALAILWLVGDVRYLALFAIGAVVPGMILAETRRRGWGLSAAVAVACGLPILGIALYPQALSGWIAAFAQELRNTAASPQFALVYPPAELERVVAYVNAWADNAPFYFPAAMLALLVGIFALGALLGELLISRSEIFSYRIPPFTHWKLNEWIVLPVGLAVIMVLTTERVFDIIGWNAILFLFLLLSVFGLSFLEYQMKTRGFPLMVKILIYVILFLAQVIAAVVLPLIALFDAKFDFRKIRAKQLG